MDARVDRTLHNDDDNDDEKVKFQLTNQYSIYDGSWMNWIKYPHVHLHSKIFDFLTKRTFC